jgi:hypothetical protein
MEAFGIAANIISIIHITTEVVKRLNDFNSTIEGLPRALKSLSVELPTLMNSLKRIQQAIDDGRVDEDSQEALGPLVKDFEQQIQALSDIIVKMRPKFDSSTARNLKAVSSFRYDSEVKQIERVIRGYVSTLTLESATSSNSQGSVGMLNTFFLPTQLRCGSGSPNAEFYSFAATSPTKVHMSFRQRSRLRRTSDSPRIVGT